MIPKADGVSFRPLGIPTIKDRIVQQCVRQVLEPICERKFHKHSYGFRPNCNAKQAIARSYRLIQLGNYHQVISFDIKSFFDKINHDLLLRQCWNIGIKDKRIIKLIKLMLQAGFVENGQFIRTDEGTPQGGIISPLLANICLNSLDWFVSK